jgi:RNA polymerase sigma-70 factor (ECF subfamily)
MKGAVDTGASLDEAHLLARLGAGDRQALEPLYDRYGAIVYGFAIRFLGRIEEAEEITQDVFWRLWKSPEAFDARRGSLRTWLVVVTRSRCLDRLRAAPREVPAEPYVAEQQVSSGHTPEVDAALAQRRRRVTDALRDLPAEQREAVSLCFFQGLSHRDVAERLGAPLGTVKSRVRMGMAKLKQHLAGLEGES